MLVRAHAKLNLALAVAPPEPAGDRGGWHPIASWMHAIELHDTLEFVRLEPGPSRYEIVADPSLPTPDWAIERDLAVRAHRALEAHADRLLPVRLRVTKRIPAGGGLGGGSSDAGATLSAVRTLFDLDIDDAELARVAHRLGSDVPFFLGDTPPRPALVASFGERVERTPRAGAGVVLIVPPFGCATPEVYGAFDEHPPVSDIEGRSACAEALAHAGRALDTALFNDLEPAARRVQPRLGDLLDTIRSALDTPVHLSGSGSTCFALCSPDETETLAERTRSAMPTDVRVLTSSLV